MHSRAPIDRLSQSGPPESDAVGQRDLGRSKPFLCLNPNILKVRSVARITFQLTISLGSEVCCAFLMLRARQVYCRLCHPHEDNR